MLRVAALITLIGTMTTWTAGEASPLLVPGASVQSAGSQQAVQVSLRPVKRQLLVPDARWDGPPERRSWTRTVLDGLRSHAAVLPDVVPRDIARYCPAYPEADRAQREAFWLGLISALAWHESTHRPTAVGGGDLWYGLTQIYPDTARRYECKARTGEALKDPEDNLSCALRIMAVTVPRDQVISHRMRGVAADWGPFHSARKRIDMMNWTRKQSYCRGLPSALRPEARPDAVLAQRAMAAHKAKLASLGTVRPRVRSFAGTQIASLPTDLSRLRPIARPNVVAERIAAAPILQAQVVQALGSRIRPKARPVREALDVVVSTQSES